MLTKVELWSPKAHVQTLTSIHPHEQTHVHRHNTTKPYRVVSFFSLSENHTRLCEKIGNKKNPPPFQRQILKQSKIISFLPKAHNNWSRNKIIIEEMKTPSCALVQLGGRELNQLSVPDILGVPTLKIRSEMAIKSCPPGLGSRVLAISRNYYFTSGSSSVTNENKPVNP